MGFSTFLLILAFVAFAIAVVKSKGLDPISWGMALWVAALIFGGRLVVR